MADEKTRFHPAGLSWSERASLNGLEAVLSPTAAGRNSWYDGIQSYTATKALKYFPKSSLLLDFGCGNGRFIKYFESKGLSVIGTEITWEMAAVAKLLCPVDRCKVVMTDGISIPVKDNSIDGVWCCGVLRYSLLVPDPCYVQIAREMFRALRPGGYVVNFEMYVDVPAERFVAGFEEAGFSTQRVRVTHRGRQFLEVCLGNRRIPERWLRHSGFLCAALRWIFDNPQRDVIGLRDYSFIWQKPIN
jgi:SAM-dependent methyltransferase